MNKNMNKEAICVYTIGGRMLGIDCPSVSAFLGKARSRKSVLALVDMARTMGASGVSIHGRGLSGEVGLDDVFAMLDAAGI